MNAVLKVNRLACHVLFDCLIYKMIVLCALTKQGIQSSQEIH